MTTTATQTSANGRRDEVARNVAESHYRVDSAIQRIIRLVDPAREDSMNEPIKLLEVNSETIAAGIQPVYFPPHAPSGVPYPTLIVEIRPEEFDQIDEGRLSLPNGWIRGTEYSRPQD